MSPKKLPKKLEAAATDTVVSQVHLVCICSDEQECQQVGIKIG